MVRHNLDLVKMNRSREPLDKHLKHLFSGCSPLFSIAGKGVMRRTDDGLEFTGAREPLPLFGLILGIVRSEASRDLVI